MKPGINGYYIDHQLASGRIWAPSRHGLPLPARQRLRDKISIVAALSKVPAEPNQTTEDQIRKRINATSCRIFSISDFPTM
jgi:hypothetical protein